MSLHRPFPGQCPYMGSVVSAGVVPVAGTMLLLVVGVVDMVVVVAVGAVVEVVAAVVAFLDNQSAGLPEMELRGAGTG